ncbi:MAG: hypothetical protein U9Q78_07520 [Chloroflexota bacterium]|nr:hypothetical protein [Chloroflexota bacterium]
MSENKDKEVDILFGNDLPSASVCLSCLRRQDPIRHGCAGREEPRSQSQVEEEEALAAEAQAAVAEEETEAPPPPRPVESAEEIPPEPAVPPRPEEQELPEAAFQPPPPQEMAAAFPQPEAVPPEGPSEEEVQEALERVSRERIISLSQEMDELYQRVESGLSSVALQESAKGALQRLQSARNILMEDPRQFDEAEYQVSQVRLLLNQVSRNWGNHYGIRIFGYEVVWFILLIAGIILRTPLVNALAISQADYIVPLLMAMIWGGIGGVVGALYSLHWHVSTRQDYDIQFNLSYLVKPFMGLVLGGIVYLIARTGFLVLQQPTDSPAEAAEWFPFLVACLAGFRQTFAYEMIDRLIQVIAPTPGAAEEEETSSGALTP